MMNSGIKITVAITGDLASNALPAKQLGIMDTWTFEESKGVQQALVDGITDLLGELGYFMENEK